MSFDPLIAAAAVATTVAVVVHGVVGYRWAVRQLRAVELPPSTLFGDSDVSVRVFGLTWHVVTAMFAVSAVALYLMAFGRVNSAELLRFISSLHAAILVALSFFARRLDTFQRPVPVVFATCMTTITVACWLASG